MNSRRDIKLVWQNFGPSHLDRCEAVATAFKTQCAVIGIELFSSSSTYSWEAGSARDFSKVTLFESKSDLEIGWLKRTTALTKTFLEDTCDIFVCNYERPEVFISSLIARLCGRRVFVMNDSKFDDYQRNIFKELFKTLLYLPYEGAIAGSARTKEYLKFLGFKKRPIHIGYNAVSTDRLDRLSASCKDKPRTHFVCVARLVEKKNLKHTLDCYKAYADSVQSPLPLHLLGNGPLESELKAYAKSLGIDSLVHFLGFVQEADVVQHVATARSLLLLSTEEQFGIAVAEAVALNTPVIVSTAVGARDHLVQSGVNGFIVEATNSAGTARLMRLMHMDSTYWTALSQGCQAFKPLASTAIFANAVKRLLEK